MKLSDELWIFVSCLGRRLLFHVELVVTELRGKNRVHGVERSRWRQTKLKETVFVKPSQAGKEKASERKMKCVVCGVSRWGIS